MSFSETARAAFRRGDDAAVARLADDEAERARAADDLPALVEALYMRSRLAIRGGDLTEAARIASEALAVAVRTGDRRLEERPRHVLAGVTRMAGDLPRARLLYQESIELNEALGNDDTVTSELHNLAFTELSLGETAAARARFATSRSRIVGGGYRDFVPYAYVGAAATAVADDDLVRAARLLGLARRAFDDLGQVPDPDDAEELAAVGTAVRAALGADRADAEQRAGAGLDPWTTLKQAVEHGTEPGTEPGTQPATLSRPPVA
ncbi:tetratricopeptide repeat protein [Promicromonospora sp. NPDC059942]|uniref:tetratricopeptide repeat protein n=1 Tax=Promicromonospora sp. NPDC059942 TaxID=3347009 RepID=UPI003659E9E7